MKTTFNNREIGHIWANQKQEFGRGSNIFFKGKTIYSYGYHFPVASIVQPGIILFTTNDYSKATAKHKSFIIRSIPQTFKVFGVPCVDIDKNYKQDTKDKHKINIDYFVNNIYRSLDSAERSNKYSDSLYQSAMGYRIAGVEYCEAFKLRKPKELKEPVPMSDKIRQKIEAQREKQEAINKKIEAERIERESIILSKVLPLWFNHLPNPEGLPDAYYLKNAYLRLNKEGDKVETTQGAKVSIRAAKVLFDLIKSGKDIKGHNIDGYTVIGINGVLTIGCHKIETTEINRFAKLMNW
jgi:hypothetical protein